MVARQLSNDHRPLSVILKKPLSQAPTRLQVLMMRLGRYDFDFHFVPGKDLLLAHTLSRAYPLNSETELNKNMEINVLEEFPDPCLQEVKEATAQDKTLQNLLNVILNGWLETKEEAIILKGSRLLIPLSHRDSMKHRLHSAHLGYDSMMRRARDAIFWSGMAKEIKQLAEACDICQKFKPCNQKETLQKIDTIAKP